MAATEAVAAANDGGLRIGQLYIVRTRARKPDTRETIVSCYVINGSSRDDVERKLPYLIDKSALTNFKITSIARVKPNAHCVYTQVQQDPDPSSSRIVTETDGGTETHEIRTNQPANRAKISKLRQT